MNKTILCVESLRSKVGYKPIIRKATIKDILGIQSLVNSFAKQDLMLARSLNELYENIRDFWVCEHNSRIIGCCALHICWDTWAEIKCLAVDRKSHKKGIGRMLVETCLSESSHLQAEKIFVLTYEEHFFKKFGFKRIKNSLLPHKIWAECINCPKFPNCQEIAMALHLKK
jgi:amino-acid N-acetyltransferase